MLDGQLVAVGELLPRCVYKQMSGIARADAQSPRRFRGAGELEPRAQQGVESLTTGRHGMLAGPERRPGDVSAEV